MVPFLRNQIGIKALDFWEMKSLWTASDARLISRRHWRRYGVFIVNFEHISHFVLNFEQVNADWVLYNLFIFIALIFSKRLRSCNACADGYQESHPESVYDVVDGAANDTTSERGSFISFVNPNDLEENTVSLFFFLRVFGGDHPKILFLLLSEFKWLN